MAMLTSTALALGGLAATAATTGMSFAQAGKQKELAKKAEQSAGIAMEEAKRALGTNYFASQAIKKEPYELQREALLSQGAKAIEAGVESERGAAPVAGMIQMSMNEGQAALTNAMRQEMTDLENKTLAEESRLRDIGVQINLGEAEGAQLAARDAAEAQARATQQGMQGVTSAASQLAAMPSLYGSQEMIEPVTAEGLKPAGTASYQTPLPTASPNLLPSRFLNPNSRNIQSIQTAAFGPQPIYPYGIPKPVFNPFTSVGGTNNIFGY